MLRKINAYVNSLHTLEIKYDKAHINLQSSKNETNPQDIQKYKKRINITKEFKVKQKHGLIRGNKKQNIKSK